MTRLPRSRNGKTPIDVVIVKQDNTKRVRITVGDDLARPSAKKNSDLDMKEVDDLIVLLSYMKKQIEDEDKK